MTRIGHRSDDDVQQQLRTLLVSGHETSATTLAWALFHIHADDTVRRKVLEELGGDPMPERMPKLPYLNAVISETLRMHPTVSIVVRQLKCPVDTWRTSRNAGDIVGVALPALHADPQVWPEPSDGSIQNVSLSASPRPPSTHHSATDIAAVPGRRSPHWSWRSRWEPSDQSRTAAARDATDSAATVHPTWCRRGAEQSHQPGGSPHVNLKQRVPLLRWSFWRMAAASARINRTGQIGDGREAAVVEYVLAEARQGDVTDVLDAIDRFAYEKSFLINVGDEKGELLDAAVRRARPSLALELGTYCGYGALRIAAAAPNAKVYSVELAEANAGNARRIWAHAGVADRITCVVGTIGDGGRTLDALATEHGFDSGALDFVFLDHDKNAYLADLQSIVDRGWLHPGSIVRRRQREDSRGTPVPRGHARAAGQALADPSSTRRTASTARFSLTWSSSRSTSAG